RGLDHNLPALLSSRPRLYVATDQRTSATWAIFELSGRGLELRHALDVGRPRLRGADEDLEAGLEPRGVVERAGLDPREFGHSLDEAHDRRAACRAEVPLGR